MAQNSTTLLDLPDHLLRKIMEINGFKSIFVLRKVCKSWRDFLDKQVPVDIKLEWIHLTTITNGIACKFGIDQEDYVNSNFPSNNTGNFVSVNDDGQGFEDLKTILQYQRRPLKTLCLTYSKVENRDEYPQMLDNFANVLAALPRTSLHSLTRVRILSIVCTARGQLTRILKLLDPWTLETISVNKPRNSDFKPEFEEMKTLELYDNLKGLFWPTKVDSRIGDFLQFDELRINLEDINAKELMDVVAKVIRSSSFKKYSIIFESFNNITQLKEHCGNLEAIAKKTPTAGASNHLKPAILLMLIFSKIY